MTAAGFAFNPDMTFSARNEMTLTGTAEPYVTNIEISDNNVVLGSAVIENGKWSFTDYMGTDTSVNKFAARGESVLGFTSIVDSTISVNGINGNPFTAVTENIGTNEAKFKMYSSNGDLEYSMVEPSGDNTIATGNELNARFVFMNNDAALDVAQTITNFHVAGNSHDTVLLPHADFANMADLLRNTTMSGGNALIQDPNGGESLTLMGVTKTEMKAHPHDFAFNGSGQLFGTRT